MLVESEEDTVEAMTAASHLRPHEKKQRPFIIVERSRRQGNGSEVKYNNTGPDITKEAVAKRQSRLQWQHIPRSVNNPSDSEKENNT